MYMSRRRGGEGRGRFDGLKVGPCCLALGEQSRKWQQMRLENSMGGADHEDFEDDCQVFWFYFRCKGKLPTGFKPECCDAIYFSKKRSSLAHCLVSDSASLNWILGIF